MDAVRISIGQEERFELRRRLGEGGYGVVYEAFDRLEDNIVALKTLRSLRPEALWEFKQEFRAAAAVAHPNLVTLLELFADGGDCFFTMELISGQPLLEYVWAAPPLPPSDELSRTLKNTLHLPQAATLTQPLGASQPLSVSEPLSESLPSWLLKLEETKPFTTSQLFTPPPWSKSPTPQDMALLTASQGLTVSQPLTQLSSPDETQSMTLTAELSLSDVSAPPQLTASASAEEKLPEQGRLHSSSRGAQSESSSRPTVQASAASASASPLQAPQWSALQVERLRATLLQVAEGLVAIHRAGLLHRDIKCSNILVREDGRAVILDFGLAHTFSPPFLRRAAEGEKSKSTGPLASQSGSSKQVVGTPAFMAPEVIRGQPSLASDWWSFGVVLYQSLTGRLPFQGSLLNVLQAIQTETPPPPSALVRGVPAELEALCLALLEKDASARPSGAQVLAQLRAPGEQRSNGVSRSLLLGEQLVGREPQLEQLHRAWEMVKAGKPVLVRVQGHSGMGKSALIQHFLSQLRVQDAPLILSGRCHERENLAFKALDPVVDGLAQVLSTYDSSTLAELLPTGWGALERLFPSVRRLLPLESESEATLDPHEQLRRAMEALRGLIGKLAAEGPLVIHLDDLQWGDGDSAPLLSELLRQPQAPAVLVLCSHRSDELERSPFLQRLLEALAQDPMAPEARVLEVDVLSTEAAERLVAQGLAQRGSWTQEQVQQIAAQGQGHPFLLSLLVERVSRVSARAREGHTLEQLIQELVSCLPSSTQQLLQGVAVAGHPISSEVLREALGLERLDFAGLGLAQAMRLVRFIGGAQRNAVLEMYHDKLRSALYEALPVERRRALHEAFGLALEKSTRSRPEWLADHFEAAGCGAQALPYVLQAAEQGMQSLAFELAASYFRRALGLMTAAPERLEVQQKLATALKLAGRGREAAEVYLEAAGSASEEDAFQLRLHAADMLLKTGFVEEARTLLAALLAPLGMRFAPSPAFALLAFLMRKFFIALRGYQPRPYVPDAPGVPLKLRAIDLATSISDGLVYWSVADSLDFASRRLLMALTLGETERAVRALASELAFIAVGGHRTLQKVERVHRLASTVLGDRPEPMPRIALHLGYGVALMWAGQWRRSEWQYRESQRLLHAQPSELLWERAMADGLILVVWLQLGQWRPAHRRAQELLQRARAVGDRLQELQMRLRILAITHVLEGELEAAEKNLELAQGLMPPGVTLFNAYALVAQVSLLLAKGEGQRALEVQRQQEKPLEGVLHAELDRLSFLLCRMQASLAAMLQANDVTTRRSLRAAVRKDYSDVKRRRAPWARAYANAIIAGVCYAEARWSVTLKLLEQARELAHAGEMEGLERVLVRMLARVRVREQAALQTLEAGSRDFSGPRADDPAGGGAFSEEERLASLVWLGWVP